MSGRPLPGVPDDAREDAHLREDTVESTQVYRGHFLDVRRDVVRLPNGSEAQREYIVHPGAVMVVPLLDDGRLVVERQYRYPLGRVMLEFPAGKLDAGEAPLHWRHPRAGRGNRLPRRRMGTRRPPAQRDRLLERGHRGVVRARADRRRARARRW